MKKKNFLILAALSFIHFNAQARVVNGHAEYWNREYNKVTRLLSHNANALAPSIVNNQNLSITKQLELGIDINIDIHWRNSYGGNADGIEQGDELWVGHGMYRSVFYKDYYGKVLTKIEEFCGKVDKKLNQIESLWFTKPIIDPIQAKFEKLKKFLFSYTEGIKPIAKMEHDARKITYGSSRRKAVLPYQPVALDPSARPLAQVLTEIRQFLDKNPDRVVTVVIEYATNNIEALANELLVAGGLAQIAHIQDPTQPWPTLGQMVESGKRLVIFINKKYQEDTYPYLHYEKDFMWFSKSGFSKKKKLLADTHLPTKNRVFKRRHQAPHNTLFELSHHLTILLAGTSESALKVNTWDVLSQRVENIAVQAQSQPTFISLDFVDLGDGLKFVDAINGVGKYKDKPLFNFD